MCIGRSRDGRAPCCGCFLCLLRVRQHRVMLALPLDTVYIYLCCTRDCASDGCGLTARFWHGRCRCWPKHGGVCIHPTRCEIVCSCGSEVTRSRSLRIHALCCPYLRYPLSIFQFLVQYFSFLSIGSVQWFVDELRRFIRPTTLLVGSVANVNTFLRTLLDIMDIVLYHRTGGV